MSVTYNRDVGVKYTTMAKYIDDHAQYIKNQGEYPEIEHNIYIYLYHIFYMFACKEMYFPNDFAMIDDFALDSAARTYMKLKFKLNHAGEIYRGEIVEPIKNILDFIKAVKGPFKVTYLQKYHTQRLSPVEEEGGIDTSILQKDMEEAITSDYRNPLVDDIASITSGIKPEIYGKILNKSTWYDKSLRRKIYLSSMLSINKYLNIPNKIKKNLVSKNKTYSGPCRKDIDCIVLWHLPDYYKDIVTIYSRRIRKLIEYKLERERSYNDLSSDTLTAILQSAYAVSDVELGD